MGAVALLLVGSGVSAALSDSVVLEDNEISSSALTGAGEVDLQVAGLDDEGCTDAADFGEGPIPGFLEEIDADDYALSGQSFLDAKALCVRNVGVPVDVSASTRVTIDQERGACEASESAAGDATCADGSAGELAEVLEVTYEWVCGEKDPIVADAPLEDGSVELGPMGTGERCTVFATPAVQTSDPALWQTDVVAYDLTVEGIEREAP
jgi:hypothetical protein